MQRKTVCLVSPGHLGSNPRLVKEANALTEAGYRVHVIYGETFPDALLRDRAILKRAEWSYEAVSLLDRNMVSLIQRTVFRMANLCSQAGIRLPWMSRLASHPLYLGLRRAALNHPADLFFGHCLPALPVVVEAARRHGARCGFDAEDFHSGESHEEGQGRTRNALARRLEASYLPECDFLTAASPLIAAQYRDRYGVKSISILNVFPLSEAVAPQPAPDIPSFYWFSQTVGPGRGLEEFLEVLIALENPVALDLRGHVSAEFSALMNAKSQGSKVVLQFLPPAAPDRMVALASGYTAGLALESTKPLNRDICLTNKAFTYLLAGTPVILSTTRAQSALAVELEEAAVLIDINDAIQAKAVISSWLDSPQGLQYSRDKALNLGRERFNWDSEKLVFLHSLSSNINDY